MMVFQRLNRANRMQIADRLDRRNRNWGEVVVEALVRATGYSAILFVALILIFLLREGLPAFGQVPLASLLGTRWYPTESHFGLLPLIGGSLLVTIAATLLAMPLGL